MANLRSVFRLFFLSSFRGALGYEHTGVCAFTDRWFFLCSTLRWLIARRRSSQCESPGDRRAPFTRDRVHLVLRDTELDP